jgi:hypothetical protein
MPSCFIIMPISTSADLAEDFGNDPEHFRHVLEHLFVPAIEKIDYTPILPAAVGSDLIHAEIIRKLETEDLVLCDMSSLNPNVFFELGIRTALDKPTCLVRDARTTVPFDTGVVNYHTYNHELSAWTLRNEIEALANHLTKSVNSSAGRNTLWKYFGLTKRAEMQTSESPTERKLDLILSRLEAVNFQPGPVSAGSGSREELIRQIVAEANQIADHVAARFDPPTVNEKTITLNLSGYVLSQDRIATIRQAGRARGFDVLITRGGKPYLGGLDEP